MEDEGAGQPESGSQNHSGQEGMTRHYLITTTVDSLRIRQGPGTVFPIVGGINETAGNKKKYTIVEERGDWGRLKSGIGWIYLWHTKRVG